MHEPAPPETSDGDGLIGLLPPAFDEEYIAGAVAPFLLSSRYVGETPSLPMIDLALSKENAVSDQLWGMLYDGWRPNGDEEGRSVFMTAYEHRGPDNERKKIYVSATTPDLIATKYRPKLLRFYEKLFADRNAGMPMMGCYFQNYYDLYWDLHVGATGAAIPAAVKEFSVGFDGVLGFKFPTSDLVRGYYMKTRENRQALKDWLDIRVQAIMDGNVPNADATFVYYWLKNGGLGENFRRKDIVFECFHNFLAFSQWGNMIYHTAAVLEPRGGNPNVRSWFEKTMMNEPDRADGAFTPLDRLVMELFRTLSPNAGSLSTVRPEQSSLTGESSKMYTPHLPTSTDPRHWRDPQAFNPDRYLTAPTTVDENRAAEAGLARCPFPRESFAFKDGRSGEITNSDFGAVYGVMDGKPYPICDAAGYAPFGFGYRRCAGEYLTVEFVKEFLRTVWNKRLTFVKLDLAAPDKVPVNPGTVLNDDIAFQKGTASA